MKLKNYKIISIFFMSMKLFAHDVPMQKYENKITDIKEIVGISNYTLAVSCSQFNPIVTYVPENFAESQDNQVHRYLLPNTTLSEDISNQTISARQQGRHVEILLFGRLIAQTAGSNSAIFMVAQ